jgi:O-antigen/teichoic acid export membrane protein
MAEMKAFRRFSLFLVPSVFQAGMSFVLLPVSTYFLDPADFGLFALISSMTALIGVVSTLGSSYLLARYFPVLGYAEQVRLISSLTWVAVPIGTACGALLVLLWPVIAPLAFDSAAPEITLVVIAVAAMILVLPWTIAVDVIRLAGRAYLYAAAIIGQSIASASALLLCLLILEKGVESLFIAALAGAGVLFAGALYLLAPYLRALPDRRYAAELFSVGRLFLLSGFAESFHQTMERTILAARGGLGQVGLYSHSQMYRTAATMPVSAVSDTAWAVTLAEARSDTSRFERTERAWNAAHLWLTLVGLVLATLGSHVIAILTHDKFTEAHAIAALWTVYLLAQNCGKPQTALFYAYGHGGSYALIQTAAMAIGTGLLFLLVPSFGMYGALAAAFAQQIFLRVGVQWRARTIRRTPFQDHWAIAGAAFITATLLSKLAIGGTLAVDSAILAAALALFLMAARRRVVSVWRTI